MPIPEQLPIIEKQSISDRIYAQLRTWIVDGVLMPGEDIKDTELAGRLGVSRTPVREALCRLRDEGLISTSAAKWTRVAGIESTEIDQLFPIINSLESLALQQAMSCLDAEDVAKMRRENERIRKALFTGQFTEAAEANRAFHMIFIERSGNPELIQLIKRVKVKIRRLGTYYFSAHRIIPSSTLEEHEQLIHAIVAKDTDGARNILARHWDHVAARVRDAARNGRPS